jgi:LacI family transcriptional regulator
MTEDRLADRRQKGATVLDVARAAGVSAQTVSRVVNGVPSVAEATRKKVQAAIEALNYHVNISARAARVGTFRVGLLYSNPSAAFLSEFLVGAMDRCSNCGAQLILEHCGDLRSQRNAIGKLIGRGVDGILIPPPLCDSKHTLKQLDEKGMPTVAVATGRPSPLASAVRIDDYAGASAMTRYLLSLGHTDIAFIKGDPLHTPAQLRYAAFVETMNEANIPVLPERVSQGMFTYRSGLEAARQLLGHASRPTAIFASNDDMAAGVIAVAHGMHLRLPEDLAICGFDDTPVATTVWPELTTVHQPIADMARAAIDLLLNQIRRRRAGEPKNVQHQVFPFSLITRESSVVKARTG